MSQPPLVIIGGAPASGKTTLGRWLAGELRLPYLGKDDIKETLYDTLGSGDLAWSRRLGAATYPLLYLFVETQLRAGCASIVESNFAPKLATPVFQALIDHYDALPFQILCRADPDVLLVRYRERATNGQRHPGHLDHLLVDELAARVGDIDLLPINGDKLVLDTTDFTTVDYASVARRISRLLDQGG